MNQKILTLMLTAVFAVMALAGCGSSGAGEAETTQADETKADMAAADQAAADQAAAEHVAALIDAIYVQERTDKTDTQCEEARAAWDALTDAQKALVEGENADPDYFGRDTGDASLDDPLNEDGIGDNEILVVSFGTSYNESRVEDIGGIEKAIQAAWPDWSVRRAFTSQIIINHIQARDGEKIDNMDQALQRAVDNGVKNLILQPTHLMHGTEYDEMVEAAEAYKDKFESVKFSEPMLGEVGSDKTKVNSDKETVAAAVTGTAVKEAGYDTLKAAAEDGTAFVFMGHGTSHKAKITYTQMQTQMTNLGYDNVYVGTVEGEPEETSCENIIKAVKAGGYTKVVLRPLMVVAGDHANNDMAGDDEDSWKSLFAADGSFSRVDVQIEGLGRIPEVEELYLEHIADAEGDSLYTGSTGAGIKELKDGIYTVDFETDSSMFRINEAYGNKAEMTLLNGQARVHIVLTSTHILNLYPGTAEDAQKDGAVLLEPVAEKVTYPDGTTEEANAFDVPVPVIGEEFDLALIGTKGVWYDHKVRVENAVPAKEQAGDTVSVSLEGGSGKASIESPASVRKAEDGYILTVAWSSPYYDYMIADGSKYLPVGTDGNSVFEIPVSNLSDPVTVIADTTAMGQPHEIEYTISFH